jgi:hypothetical protein
VSCVTSTVFSLLVRRSLLNKYLLACSVDLRVGCRPVLCGGPSTDVSPYNIDAYWLMDAQSLYALYSVACRFRVGVQVTAGAVSAARKAVR